VNKQDVALKIANDPDFINSPKYNNSLASLLEDNPEGVSDSVICKTLCLSQEELLRIYNCAILKLRMAYGINDEQT
jgi:hypothetical protein